MVTNFPFDYKLQKMTWRIMNFVSRFLDFRNLKATLNKNALLSLGVVYTNLRATKTKYFLFYNFYHSLFSKSNFILSSWKCCFSLEPLPGVLRNAGTRPSFSLGNRGYRQIIWGTKGTRKLLIRLLGTKKHQSTFNFKFLYCGQKVDKRANMGNNAIFGGSMEQLKTY